MERTVVRGRVVAAIAVALLVLTGCGGNNDKASGSGGSELSNLSGTVKASGASFPDAYYQEVISAFNKAAPNVTVNYNATGSGTGKKEFGQGLTDFAGSDSLVKDSDGIAAGSFYYVPTVAAPITVSYNLSGVSKLQLSADAVSKIFQRQVKTWNDPVIAADNPGVTLPGKPITVVHRSDGSGTTNNFTRYLDAASQAWTLGTGDTVAWPADTQAGAKNTGVAQLIKQTDGAIGYVDLSDAQATKLVFAAVRNKDGKYVAPTLEGTTAGLSGAEVKDDLSYNPLNAAGPDAYPITAPTFILVRTKYEDANKARLVKAFLTYLLSDGQALAKDVSFAPLPQPLRDKALGQLDKIQG